MVTTALVLEKEDGPGSVLDLVAKRPRWTVEGVATPAAALERLGENEFEVLVADTEMVCDEKDWLATVRDRHPDLPVVLVAPLGGDDMLVRALLIGAATYVPRDRLSSDLMATVERIVALSCVDNAPPVGETLAETSHRYLFANDRSAVPPVLRHVQAELERYAVCGRADQLRVAVAVEEALVNAIVHGNLEVPSSLRERGDDSFERAIADRRAAPPYAHRRAMLTATFRPGEVTFVVADEGPGFDPADVPDPTDPENLIKPHGRGLLLMRTFMDEARHNPKGNEVTLIKRAPGRPSP